MYAAACGLVDEPNEVFGVTQGRRYTIIQGGPKKTAHGFYGDNFVYSQSFFIIFGTYTL